MNIPAGLLSCLLAVSFMFTVDGDDGISIIGDDWGAWTPCSEECGGGTQSRQTMCGVDLCGQVIASCHQMSCDDPYLKMNWSDCTRSCGGGSRSVVGSDSMTNPPIRCNTHSCVPTRGECIGDVVFVVDSSGSIGSKNWKIAVQFIIDVMKGLKVSPEGTHVSVITFSTEVEISFGLNVYFSMSNIEPVVFDLVYMAGVTNTADGIKAMHQLVLSDGRNPDEVTPIAVVITDGVSTIDAPRTLPEAEAAKNDSIEMFVVAIGDQTNMDEIHAISSGPDYVFHVDNYESVQNLTKEIAKRICKVTKDPCSRCDFTNGQIWLPDHSNCHLYYICEPLGSGEYSKLHATCGELFWNQAYHTCVPVMPEDSDCDEGPVSLYIQPTTPKADCPYEPYPNDASKFWIPGDALTIRHCLEGMQFFNVDGLCDCLPVAPLNPTCADDLLLYFPYEDHYNDVTCHQAIATHYGEGVSIRHDPTRGGNVACFTGETHFEVAFLRTWFANNKADTFTVAVWFKRRGEDMNPQGIVNNGDCLQTAGFLIGHSSRRVVAEITTENGGKQLPDEQVSTNEWHHAAWVYDGMYIKLYVDKVLMSTTPMTVVIVYTNEWHHAAWVYDGMYIKLYVDKVLMSTTPMTGYLTNNDVPMYIANCCGEHFFVGCLDELRVYERALAPWEVSNL